MTSLERWTPIRELDRMERRMRRLFEDAGFFAAAPASDVYETEAEYVIEIEVPGFEEGDLEVEVADHGLVVKGTRTEETHEERTSVLLHERLEREFERRFDLPFAGDLEHVSAGFDKGVLTLHVPKVEAARPRKIAIGQS
jgi:HSP20 family protein